LLELVSTAGESGQSRITQYGKKCDYTIWEDSLYIANEGESRVGCDETSAVVFT
jgi:hypothetical protein